jgi:hypothetical protein
MNEITRDISGDTTGDITWMTYAELGRARGISPASAKRLAIRRHWRRHQGNDGTARVAVPVTEAVRRDEAVAPTSDVTSDAPGDVTRDVTGWRVSGRRGGANERSVRHAKRTRRIAFKSARVTLCNQRDSRARPKLSDGAGVCWARLRIA